MTRPPPLPLGRPLATKDQRIRAGLIDHFIDSSLWFWFFILVGWSVFHLDAPVDARSFLVDLATNFPISLMIIALFFVLDILLCVSRGQSIGQCINRIYKTHQRATSKYFEWSIFNFPKIWLHGLVSRCLGMPLLFLCLMIWFIVNPMVTPMNIHEFSLVDPEGAYQLLVFLLKMIGTTLLLFGLFLPFGLGFIREELPTWYDQMLGVYIVEKSQKSHS
ncbi:MAG: hypothetical protein NVS3B3_14350 [Aquirhabdus sp.]